MNKQTVFLFRVYDREHFDKDTLLPTDDTRPELQENWGAKAPAIARIHEEAMALEEQANRVAAFEGREPSPLQYQLEQYTYDSDKFRLSNSALPFSFYEKSPNWEKAGDFSFWSKKTGELAEETDPEVCQRKVLYSLPGEFYRSSFARNMEHSGKPIKKVVQATEEVPEEEKKVRKERPVDE